MFTFDPLFVKSFGLSLPLETSFDRVGYDYFTSSPSRFYEDLFVFLSVVELIYS